ncbi:type II toxin-antitoxin system VapB family antitoxin [Tepidimonas sediminis]|nr:type II toxin-antitoxin system VapB family antitoxin [Tepidimonas sediminis]
MARPLRLPPPPARHDGDVKWKAAATTILNRKEEVPMRTQLVLDDRLFEEAMRLAEARSKRDLIEQALREFVARRRERRILGLVGEPLIDPEYDVRAVRAAMQDGAGR